MSDHDHHPAPESGETRTEAPRSDSEPWRTLAEWRGEPDAGPPERELPAGFEPASGSSGAAGMTRRSFLQLLGATGASAAVAACSRPPRETIVPYNARPEDVTPGQPLHYATAMPLAGFATGLLVTAYEGRPTKIEGNPDHPASLGATLAVHQAAIQQLYDPARARLPLQRGAPSSRARLLSALEARLAALEAEGGARLALLVEPSASPLLGDLYRRIRHRFPKARLVHWSAIDNDATRRASSLLGGPPLEPVYDFSAADVVVSLDADFLHAHPLALRYARAFAQRRGPDGPMNRLYQAEPTWTPTGTLADERVALRPSRVAHLAWALANALRERGALGELRMAATPVDLPDRARTFVRRAAADLARHRGRSLVLAGPGQPAPVHAMALALNLALGNLGKTLHLFPALLPELPEDMAGLRELTRAMLGGAIDALIVTAFDPVQGAPADVPFARALARVPFSLYLGLFEDPTARACTWFSPASHFLESWGDARALDGAASVIQPLIEPLYESLSEPELLAAVAGLPRRTGHALVKEFWRAQRGGLDFEQQWQRWLQDGLIADTELAPASARLNLARAAGLAPPPSAEAGLESHFVADRKVLDGRFANNAWLQELPEPITKIAWDNAALVSPSLARELRLEDGDVVELRSRNRSLRAWVCVLPGQADGCVTLPLGYGRLARADGAAAEVVGFDANRLRDSRAPWFDSGLTLVPARGRHPLARTQDHFRMRGRNLALALTAAELKARHAFFEGLREQPPSLYPEHPYPGHRWGMAIDLGRCTSCSACVVACQAENNIPVVGKRQVLKGREMHWLRVDRYFVGGPENPATLNQPLMCVHCEKAPCEYVCPVNATVHSDEGLNEMVYNRCVGTRYCSNNCPYKVRRFNFLHFTRDWAPSERLQKNPQVTVRSRGVMEKCTYCVQRIQRARIDARVQGRALKDGEVVTACAQACPTEAIVFGDLGDADSRVSRLRERPNRYDLLHELGTQPRTGHLARILNPAEEEG